MPAAHSTHVRMPPHSRAPVVSLLGCRLWAAVVDAGGHHVALRGRGPSHGSEAGFGVRGGQGGCNHRITILSLRPLCSAPAGEKKLRFSGAKTKKIVQFQ